MTGLWLERPFSKDACRRVVPLDLGLLGYLKNVVNLDPQISNRGFELGVAEKKLHRPKVLGPPVDERCLRPAD
jgi:hypothetical protein